MGNYEKLLTLQKEIDFYEVVNENLRYCVASCEEMKGGVVDIKELRIPLLKSAGLFLTKLEGKADELLEEVDELTLKLLHENHDIMLGDRITYDHPGVKDKGEFILDESYINLPSEYNQETNFSLRGRRYRRDGSIGLKIIHESIPFYARDVHIPPQKIHEASG